VNTVHYDQDPVDRALESLRCTAWTQRGHEHQLEERLMQEFDSRTVRSRINRYSVPIVALIVVLIGGAGFAATGGVQAAKNVLIKVKLMGADGALIEGEFQPVLDESGEARFQVLRSDGKTANVVVQPVDGNLISIPGSTEGQPHQIMVQVGTEGETLDPKKLQLLAGEEAGKITLQRVTVTGSGGANTAALLPEDTQNTIQLQVNTADVGGIAEATASLRSQRQIVDEIDEPAEVFEWEGADGATRTISIVPNPADANLGGYTIYSTLQDGRYAELGRVILSDAEAMPIDLVVNDDDTATLILSGPGGQEINVPVRPVLTAEEFQSKQSRSLLIHKTDRTEELE
jgi:hypothetical protein